MGGKRSNTFDIHTQHEKEARCELTTGAGGGNLPALVQER